MDANEPPKLPRGVRTAETIKTSFIENFLLLIIWPRI